jgi:biotin synthase
MATQEIIAEARRAKESGATRFCMGAAWRSRHGDVHDTRHADSQASVPAQGRRLDYYNHNLDT